jgi:hypothetical protein
MSNPTTALRVELAAVIVAVTDEEPRVLAVREGAALPSGPLEPGHRTLELGLRSWVEARTHHPLGYVEQLYTFADRDRTQDGGGPAISLSYLALTREAPPWGEPGAGWFNWYRFFPWEDWRGGMPGMIRRDIAPRLAAWQAQGAESERQLRAQRIAFAFDPRNWNEELVLQRYELLYEAGMVPEAMRDRAMPATRLLAEPGQAMLLDHRRILATGISRLRAKIKYRPVVFELMAENFTLLQLQRTVEALAGQRLHKQNFRRLIAQQGLVEETGQVLAETGGRPARLVRFRRDVLAERAAGGTRLPLARAR